MDRGPIDELRELLRRQNELLHQLATGRPWTIIRTAAEGICVCRTTEEFPFLQFSIWNDRMTDLTGYTMDEINRLGWYQTVYPDPAVRELAKARMARMRAGDDLRFEEWTITRKSGEERILAISTSVVDWGDSGGVAVVALMHDVTERREAEEKLRRSETRLRRLIEGIPDLIFRLDREGRIVDVSMAAAEDLLAPPQAFLGKDYRDVVPPLIANRFAEAAARAKASNAPESFDYEVSLPDGRLQHFDARVINDPEDGHVLLVRNVTDQKRAEQQLRESEQAHRVITESAQEAILTVDEGGTIVFANPAVAPVFGYDPEELVGQDIALLVPESLRDRYVSAGRRYLAAAEQVPREILEVMGRHKSGRVISGELSFGKHTRYGKRFLTGILRDTTERKRMEQQLREREVELAHAGRVSMLGGAVSEIAHEINQPLFAIANLVKASMIELENKRLDPGQLHERLKRIDQLATTAGDILHRIRGFLTKNEPNYKSVAVQQVIRESMAFVEFEARRKYVRIECVLPSEPIHVLVDRIQIQQVLLNLIRNAFDAMEQTVADHRVVRVAAKLCDDGTVEVSVKDHGGGFQGITPKAVFQAFQTTKSQGMGLGMTISQRIIEAHGGRMWAEENAGTGITMFFQLPSGRDPAP